MLERVLLAGMAQASAGSEHLHPAQPAGAATPFFQNLFKVYTPRQVCMFGEAPVIWLHIISDLLIGLAYFSIPVALVLLLRRRQDLAFSGMFWLFAIFILACGTTHFLGVAAIWMPLYRLDGLIKMGTGLVSVFAAAALWRHLPQIVALPSPREILRASEVAWQGTFENAAVGIANVSLDGRWMRLNDALCRITGYTRQELLATTFQAITHPDDLGLDLDLSAKLAAGEIPTYTIDKRYLRKDGSTVWVSLTVSLHQTPLPGEDPYFISVVQDITTRKVAEEGRRQAEAQVRRSEKELEILLDKERAAREEAERASRLKDEFLATVSHELRTPLNAIYGWTQLLVSSDPGNPEIRKGLETVLRNARSQGQIIDDLLDMSRIISGKIRLDVQTVDLPQVLERTLDTMRPAAEAKGIRIEATIDPTGPVKGDPGRLQQIFWNIFSNAIRFTPKGGKIQVVLERVRSHLEVTVSDTGEGIDPEFLPFVFDRFRQQDGSTTRKHGGLGVGLSLVKSLVELHGGQVRAASPGVGQGATFVIQLPISLTDLAGTQRFQVIRPPLPEEDHAPSLAGVKILIVDDEPDTREIIQRILERSDAQVVAASSAGEALTLLRQEKPQILISDIGMPSEDGYWLIGQVRALDPDEGGRIPAVALTAFARLEDRRRAFRSGFQAHVTKPVEPADLVYVVAGLVGRPPRQLHQEGA